MPTYSYRCPECGHSYQKLQRMSDDTRAECPECGAPGERLITAGGGIVFKGSGFYITDYKRAGESKERDGSKKQKPEKQAPSEKSAGEAKPDKPGSTSPKSKPGANS